MRWDIFCRVIDNWGDVGVCWRLARDIASRGDTVRLWLDDVSALSWMAPHGSPGVTVIEWTVQPAANAIDDATDDAGVRAVGEVGAPDFLIEAFGCEPAPEVVAGFAARADSVDRSLRARRSADGQPMSVASAGATPCWINLEYLSAEPYVERLHRLPSPIFKGPGAGMTRHFFYPGFTPTTGGLLREAGLDARRESFDRAGWLASHGIRTHGETLISLFCYEPAALQELLANLEAAPQSWRLLVTAGRASKALPPGPTQRGALKIDWLPALPQDDFDHLLWSCSLNFVRGEDSLVRALWAGEPFVWQIYPQDDDVHHVKLEAFLDWLVAPASLRRFHRVWNGISGEPLPELDAALLAEWRGVVRAARARLLMQDDLVTQLRRFVGLSDRHERLK